MRPGLPHHIPALQGVHWEMLLRLPAAEKVPAGQGTSSPVTEPPGQAYPAGQATGWMLPAGQNRVEGQVRQAARPVTLAYDPALQGTGAALPPAQKDPREHRRVGCRRVGEEGRTNQATGGHSIHGSGWQLQKSAVLPYTEPPGQPRTGIWRWLTHKSHKSGATPALTPTQAPTDVVEDFLNTVLDHPSPPFHRKRLTVMVPVGQMYRAAQGLTGSTSPGVSHCQPARQGVQSDAAALPVWLLYVPFPHASGVTVPFGQKRPFGHTSPIGVPYTLSSPPGVAVQLPAVQKNPPKQGPVATPVSGSVQYWPGAQSATVVAPPGQNSPARQRTPVALSLGVGVVALP